MSAVTFISLPAGIARMNVATFVLYTFPGSLPWSPGLAYADCALGEHWTDVGPVLRKYEILVVVVILALLTLFLYRHLHRPHNHSNSHIRGT